MALIVHRLTAVNKLPLASGKFEMADNNDVDLPATWSMAFEEEKDPAVRKSEEQVLICKKASNIVGALPTKQTLPRTISIRKLAMSR
jgi:hypothetical protein